MFTGWKELESSPFLWPLPPTYYPLLVFRPRTWLLCNWDRFYPLIGCREALRAFDRLHKNSHACIFIGANLRIEVQA